MIQIEFTEEEMKAINYERYLTLIRPFNARWKSCG